MTLKSKRRVMIISDIKSDKIEQAIFILRDDAEHSDGENLFSKNQSTDLVLEAHRIINSFMYPDALDENENITPSDGSKFGGLAHGLFWLMSCAAVIIVTMLILRAF